ncbi:hypothetical protein [Emticicia agri]|uniref:Uncharacterized protein n=1 Tax=Emticicia agri TaxID=2492393 RepID=A0A4Q5LQX2_9BACT|nr:hypothetical protein [Emticicia agri]RYU91807.1 hypothetical protein EWM59_26630 [Emticicia agri]
MRTFERYNLNFQNIIDAPNEILNNFFNEVSREELISWLSWNDRNGIYEDRYSIMEFGNVMTKEKGIEIMRKQIEESI